MLKRLYDKIDNWLNPVQFEKKEWTKEEFFAKLDETSGQEADFTGPSGIMPLEQSMRAFPEAHTQQELAWYVQWLNQAEYICYDTQVKPTYQHTVKYDFSSDRFGDEPNTYPENITEKPKCIPCGYEWRKSIANNPHLYSEEEIEWYEGYKKAKEDGVEFIFGIEPSGGCFRIDHESEY